MKKKTLSKHEMIMNELNYKTIGGSLLGLFSVVARLFSKPCPHCKSRNSEIIGYATDGANKHQYTMRQCRDCGEMYR